MFKPITSLDEIPKKTPEEKAELDRLMAEALKSFPPREVDETTKNDVTPLRKNLSEKEIIDNYNEFKASVAKLMEIADKYDPQ